MWVNSPAARDAFDTAHARSELMERSRYAPDVIHGLQHEKLGLLWSRAEEVPYYRDLPAWHTRDLSRLPVLAKDRLKAAPHDFERPGIRPIRYYESSASGGIPTPTPRLPEDLIHNVIGVAGMWRRALGGEPGKVSALLPSDIVPVCDFVAGVSEYLGHTFARSYPFNLGICDWDRLEALFTNYRPDHVFAAPGVWAQWTRILKSRGRLAGMRESVRTVLLLGEVSLPGQRRRLAADWDADVLDASYGSTETGTIAATCEHGGLHLLLAEHVAELRSGDEIRPAEAGATGELIVTPLNNFARPLLRFGTGDVVEMLADPCPCGLPLPTMRVHGRGADGVALRDVALSEHLIGSIVYGDPRLTGYLVQLRPDGSRGRLVLEKDVDVTAAPDDLTAGVEERFAAAGIAWDEVVVVSQLPPSTKSGGSQKSWKRTNMATLA